MPSVSARRILIGIAAVLLCAIGSGWFAAAQERNPKPAQASESYYEGEGPFAHCVQPPDNVIAALSKRPEVADALEGSGGNHPGNLNRFFCAARIQLSDKAGKDYLISGLSPLTGADAGWFWIVSSSPHHPRVLLFAAGNAVLLLTTRTKGYKDVESLWASASEERKDLYRFDGVRYKDVSTDWADRTDTTQP